MKRTRTIFLVIFLMLLCVDINIYAAENENMDYDEEIEMFQDFYAHADDYIFQDAEGNDITAYVYEQEENFKMNSYQTTDILMEKVRSVQKRSPMLSRTASKSKTWSNMKVYFKKNKYCVYSVTGTYTLSGNKITNGKAIPKIVDKNSIIYQVDYIKKTISQSGKRITFVLNHSGTINGMQIEIITKHTINI